MCLLVFSPLMLLSCSRLHDVISKILLEIKTPLFPQKAVHKFEYIESILMVLIRS